MKKMKNRKHKTKQHLEIIFGYNNLINKIRAAFIENLELFFRKICIWEWVNLFDAETAIPILFATADFFQDNKEDDLIRYLRHEFTDSNDFLFLNYYVIAILKPINIINPADTDAESTGEYFYAISLLSFPFCVNLEKDKMKIIREGIQAKMINLAAMIESFW